ncbi:MAG: Fe-S cluster assembly protein SufD [Verrucomicrobia bacterium]|nr:Fe-S cluster assembly protein SufD [Verrucomicrobiota bacterium]
MTATKTSSTTDLSAHLAACETFAASAAGPDWLKNIRRNGATHFTELGFPTIKLEDWIYTNVAPITKLAFKPATTAGANVTAEQLAPFRFPDWTGPRLVFVNGHFAPALSTLPAPKQGVTITNLAAAIASGDKLVEAHLSRHARVDESGFSALNTAFLADGAFIALAPNAVADEPVHLLFLAESSDAANTAQPRNLIVAGANSSAKIVEHYVSLGSATHFTNAVTEIALSEGAHIEHAKFQEENLEAFHIATVQATLARNSRFISHSISTGARLARHNINLVMTGEGVDCVMNGLYAVGGKQLVDHHTVADHAMPHCGSHEFYHGILGGSSRGVFNGKIFVRKDAQKTDAKQTSRNLLLTDTATVDTKPQLEILADDVKCTHGATVGQLNDEALFYCRTRGIAEVNARRLLTHAFASEIVNRITVEPVREHLEQVLWARLEELIEKK